MDQRWSALLREVEEGLENYQLKYIHKKEANSIGKKKQKRTLNKKTNSTVQRLKKDQILRHMYTLCMIILTKSMTKMISSTKKVKEEEQS